MPIVPLVAIFGALILPLCIGLIAILTEHQRKMALILRENQGGDRIQSLEKQVGELTELIHRQTIALDSIAGPASSALSENIHSHKND